MGGAREMQLQMISSLDQSQLKCVPYPWVSSPEPRDVFYIRAPALSLSRDMYPTAWYSV
jgi:hypothetical protein